MVVAGAVANKPGNAGEAWVRLSWVRGLARLGFQTYLVEQIDEATCVAADGRPAPLEESVNLAWFRQVVDWFGIEDAVSLVRDDGDGGCGISSQELRDLLEASALLVNISGNLRRPDLLRAAPRAAYVDLDPGFTQFWHASGDPGARLDAHDAYFTVGENVGAAGCSIPTNGVRWRPLRPPVVMDDWPVTEEEPAARFTTVASWRGGYGPVTYEGRTFGLKVHEFRRHLDIPARCGATFEIALDIHPADEADLKALRRHGWRVREPSAVVPDPASFRSYVQGSGAEFSVAQGIYVETGSGWFSDRSTRYLASGRPVLLQDTGFSDHYPTGEGLIAFRSPSEAVAGAERILRDYELHARAARALAEEYFDSDRVLGGFLDAVGVAP